MVKMEAFEDSHLCLRLLEVILLITLVALFLLLHACLILKIDMEAFDDSNFKPQAVRVGLTGHTGSIVSSMACMFDLKNRF